MQGKTTLRKNNVIDNCFAGGQVNYYGAIKINRNISPKQVGFT